MSSVAIFLVDGFEDIEAMVVIDLLRRANISVDIVSVFNQQFVTSSHKVVVMPDIHLEQCHFDAYDMLVLPGGPGTHKYIESAMLVSGIVEHYHQRKWIGAICAAPYALYQMGILSNETITCFNSVKQNLMNTELILTERTVVVDKHLVTGQAAGSTYPFALKLIELLTSEKTACDIATQTYYHIS